MTNQNSLYAYIDAAALKLPEIFSYGAKRNMNNQINQVLNILIKECKYTDADYIKITDTIIHRESHYEDDDEEEISYEITDTLVLKEALIYQTRSKDFRLGISVINEHWDEYYEEEETQSFYKGYFDGETWHRA